MNGHQATVFKSGNSYALRVPKLYIESQQLQVGDKVYLAQVARSVTNSQDRHKLQDLIVQLQEVVGAEAANQGIRSIGDPVIWQRELRQDRG
ncbi:hypothetical protein H6792_00060 [Candidatus Nomurabacteria bacterium]|nr:hypothetical protein [Candidatus Nomurabacteria bacterium]